MAIQIMAVIGLAALLVMDSARAYEDAEVGDSFAVIKRLFTNPRTIPSSSKASHRKASKHTFWTMAKQNNYNSERVAQALKDGS